MCVWSGVEWSVAGGRNARIERISKSTRMQPQSYKKWGSSDCKREVGGGNVVVQVRVQESSSATSRCKSTTLTTVCTDMQLYNHPNHWDDYQDISGKVSGWPTEVHRPNTKVIVETTCYIPRQELRGTPQEAKYRTPSDLPTNISLFHLLYYLI